MCERWYPRMHSKKSFRWDVVISKAVQSVDLAISFADAVWSLCRQVDRPFPQCYPSFEPDNCLVSCTLVVARIILIGYSHGILLARLSPRRHIPPLQVDISHRGETLHLLFTPKSADISTQRTSFDNGWIVIQKSFLKSTSWGLLYTPQTGVPSKGGVIPPAARPCESGVSNSQLSPSSPQVS